MTTYDLIAILGPTASGKTSFAAALADRLHTEIISADSRQVYRGMDIGTGKDLADYQVEGRTVPHHLIDIVEPGYKYNVFEYQRDFLKAYESIRARKKLPVVCGGTGLYLESVLKGYRLLPVPENPELRRRLEGKSLEELTELLKSYKTLHNTTDVDTAQRAIRAIEIEEYYTHGLTTGAGVREQNSAGVREQACAGVREQACAGVREQACAGVREQACAGVRGQNSAGVHSFPALSSLIVGIDIERELRREKISRRLQARLDEGMVDEVRGLLGQGVAPEDLIYYGLEYKYLTLYVTGRLSYDEMFRGLEIAIHQFAKRQMTWFRGMERRGFTIHWMDARWPMEEKIAFVMRKLE